MNPLKIIPLLITLVFIPSSAIAVGKHALLIGIQEYDYIPKGSRSRIQSLNGPINDVKLTKSVLRERFGFQEDNFIILLNKQATHTGIKNAFQRLIDRVKSNDFVYIHYSGHGSQTEDLNGDERSGKDQTWVSYGARRTNEAHIDNYDVLDDEINAWLAALKTDQIVFVSDSCHSATVSRAVSQGFVRAVEDDKRPHLLGKPIYSQLTTHHGIRVGAARDDKQAVDGVFTWHWVQSLQQAQAGNTWNDVFKRTYIQISARRYNKQQPQIEGDHRQQVLGGGFTPQPPTVPVEKIADDWIEIKAGLPSGVTKGSVYRLYKPQHPNLQNLPRLTIMDFNQKNPFVSYGEPEPEGAFQTGDLVIEEEHVYHFPPIKVYLEQQQLAPVKVTPVVKTPTKLGRK